MKTKNYDILVVGAGPAGASAAAEAARRKMRVLLVERRKVVGSPVQCAEYVPAPLVGELNIGKHYIVQSVRGMKTFFLNQEVKETPTPGCMIHRDIFDQILVDKARRKGADILLGAKVLSRNGNEVIVKRKTMPALKINAGIIIGADGPLSTVGKWIDSTNRNLIAAVQIRVPLTRRLDFAQIYFSPEIYAGYAWLFPKGTEANLGLGAKQKGNHPPPLGKLLDQFISQRLSDGLIERKPSHIISGWIPSQPVQKIVHENIVLAGDAAGQTHPITGAGIFPAVTCGHMAGKWAARAVCAKDIRVLSRYEEEFIDLFGDSMQRAVTRRRLMEEKWDGLEEILKYCWVAFKEYYERT